MKKNPSHKLEKYAITAQMASESRLRTQQWLKSGCNGFDLLIPVSNPMSFWTEQDVLLYIKLNNIEIASVYGEVLEQKKDYQVETDDKDTNIDLSKLEEFELDRPLLYTSGCNRTGCMFCGFGLHLEKRPNRLELITQVSNPNILDYMLRGGNFDKDGLWKPDNRGLGFWFVLEWINKAGNFDVYIPNYEKYKVEYSNERTIEELKKADELGVEMKKLKKLRREQRKEEKQKEKELKNIKEE